MKEMNETKIPDFVRRAERLLVKRGGKHFSGNKVTNDFFQVKKKAVVVYFLIFSALLG